MTVKVELFTSDLCPRCSRAKAELRTVIDDLGAEYFELCLVNVVKHLDRAVALGVLSTPAMAIEGELVFAPLPRKNVLKAALKQYL